MKIHEMLVTELVTNGEFRSAFLEYARERVGAFADGPIADWPLETTTPAPTMKPDVIEWRILDADEIVQDGDQWAPLHDPERWRPVGDSVGRVAGQYRKSRFRRDVASPHPAQRGLLVGDEPIVADPDPVDVDARRRREWRVLEPHEIRAEGDRYANPHNHGDRLEYTIGRTVMGDERPYPIIRRIVTERDGLAARPGYRILDPEETVPSLPTYWTPAPAGQMPEPGTRVGDRIIEVPIVEVPNA